jgi:polyvinyl alcohol dehydrogenase (cytochrome)
MRTKLMTALALAGLLVQLVPASVSAQAGCSSSGAGGDWPLYGHDLSNTRNQTAKGSPSTATAPTLAPAWTFSSQAAGGHGDFTGTPVEAGGCVFVGSNMGWIYAIDAGTGKLVWKQQLPRGGTINSSLGVAGERVFGFASAVGRPYVVAFDRHDGHVLWTRVVDRQPGADAFASPTVYRGIVFVGVSGDAAQHADQEQLDLFHGSFVLLDAATGRILRKTYTIPKRMWKKGFAGGTVTAVAAIDTANRIAYVGTGSAFRPQQEAPNDNAILKIDLDRASPTFGRILGSVKGSTFDDFIPGFSSMPCEDLPIPPPPAIVPTGRGVGACGDVDVDFAASPNLFRTADGRLMVGESQKSGVYHTAEAGSMHAAWSTTWGPPQPFGGTSTAFDGIHIFGAGAPPGNVFALDPATGAIEWVAPIGDGAHYGLAVATANGVVYTLDLKGFIDAYDAATGLPLLHRPILVGSGAQHSFTFGGVSIARGTVFASVGIQSTGLDPTGDLDGYVVAFRPQPLA